ncbi:MAG: hypothetical protein GW778_03570 [Alphaproteobacteria bacterium]|nr:hypothetical protein [Alphaproteobacteria bacterium]
MAGHNQETFANAATVEHAILGTYDIIVPVAPAEGNNTLVFRSFTEGADNNEVAGFEKIPNEVLSGYQGSNIVALGAMTTDHIEGIAQSAVSKATLMLGEERLEGILPEGIDAVEAVHIFNGQIDSEQAYDLIGNGILEALEEFRSDAMGTPDGGSLDMNDPEHAAVFNNVDSVYAGVKLARDLPAYTSQLSSQLDAQNPTDYGVSQGDWDKAQNVLDGTVEPQRPDFVPGANDI